MKTAWGDLNARAAGLATHLLPRGELVHLAGLPDLGALAADLARRGLPVEESARSASALDLAVRRDAAAHLQTVARWCGHRIDTLAVVFDDEDRRSLRAILRGMVQRSSAESRTSGLVPTPALPERALAELCRQTSVAGVAAILSAWRHPYASALLEEAAAREPDLLRLEGRLNRAFAARALRGVRQSGRRSLLMWYIRLLIDLENAYAATVLAGTARERTPDVFVAGGAVLIQSIFEQAARSSKPQSALRVMRRAFANTPLAAIFASPPATADIERLVLARLVAEFRRLAIRDPLGPAPVLRYALRVRAQVMDLRQIIWGISLAAPASALAEALVAA